MIETRFNVCDLNAIETRVGAWLAQCGSLMKVFEPYTDPLGHFHRNGRDPYLDFASKMYSLPYEKLFMDKEGHNGKEAKNDAKRKRQVAKPGVLGAIYRMSGGTWGRGKASYIDHVEDCPHKSAKRKICDCERVYDRIRTGLWGYAYGMGVEMEQKEAHFVVDVFRSSYQEICGNGFGGNPKGIWVQLEDAVLDVMDPKRPATSRRIGPNGCVLIDRMNLVGRNPLMRMHLPSGRVLHYLDAFLADTLMPWTDKEGNAVYRPALHYAHEDQTTGVWGTTHTHGGKLFENLVQGIARDVLAVKLMDFERHDLPVRGHVHDEGITITPNDPFSPGVEEMVDIMSAPIGWAPGLLLGADGFEESFYHK